MQKRKTFLRINSIISITPEVYKKQKAPRVITYGFARTPFGSSLIAQTSQGICALYFVAQNAPAQAMAVATLKEAWEGAKFKRCDTVVSEIVASLFSDTSQKEINLYLKGTSFQLKVWYALMQIPFGEKVSYSHFAALIGDKKAVRAVSSAIGRNPISYIIPCHRVVRKGGEIGQYRWGTERKAMLLQWEKLLLNYKNKFF